MGLKPAQFKTKSMIGRRLMVYVMLFSGCIIFITTLISLFVRYQEELREVDRQVEQIATVQIAGIKNALWKFDDEELKLLLDSALRLRDISYLSIDPVGGQQIKAGVRPSTSVISRSYPLTIETNNLTTNLGTLEVVATLDGVYERLIDQLGITLLANAVTIFSFAIFIFFLIQTTITSHLKKVADYTRQIDPENPQVPLVLDRPIRALHRQDELDEVARSINEMQINLRHSEQRLLGFAEAASDWLWEMDDRLNYIYVSDRFYAISGRTAEDFIGTHHEDLNQGKSGKEEWPDHLRRLDKHLPFRDFAFSAPRPDGREQWFRLSGNPIFDEDGLFRGYRGTGSDITSEMRAREEAVASTLRFFDAIENVSDGIAFWSSDGKFVLCNGIYRAQAGPAGELLVRGTSYETFLRGLLGHEVILMDKSRWEHWISQRLEEREDPPGPREVYRSGRWLLVRDGKSPDGNTVSVTTDITDLKQREHHLELIINAVPVLLAYIDNNQCCQLVNKTFADWFGISQNDIQGKPIAEIFGSGIYTVVEHHVDTALSGEFVRFQNQTQAPTSEEPDIRTMEVTYTPDFARHNEVDGFFVAATDITDRIRAELEAREGERALQEQTNILKASFDAIEEGIGVWDADDRLAAWNNTFQRLLEYPNQLIKVGTPRARFRNHLLSVGVDIANNEEPDAPSRTQPLNSARHFSEFNLTMPDGRHLNIHRFDILDGGTVTTYRDITEIKRAQQRIRQAQKMEAIGQLTGGLAHDFNNLLAVIVGSLNLLDERISDEKLHKLVSAALRASRRGAELTQRLLAFGRRQALITEVADANELIEGLTELLERTLGGSTVIKTNLGENLWRMEVDKGQLENALINLAINARDAMPAGGVLRIETQNVILDKKYALRHEDVIPGSYALISVSDTGTGMSPETLERVFEPFFTTKGVGTGTGLGLSMIYGFVKQSKGHIRLYSEVGHGTVVRLYLPTTEEDLEVPQIEVQPAAILDDFRGQNERILIIEDDPDVSMTAQNILVDLGYRVKEASSDDEAYRIYGDGSDTDLIFSDVFLHGSLNGPEIVRELRKRRPDLPVLFTSGYTADQLDQTDMLEESVHFIPKPFERVALAKKLRELLGDANT